MGKIIKYTFIIFFFLAILGCGTSKFNATYSALDYNDPDKRVLVKLNLPKGFKTIKKTFDHSTEYRYVYPDSSTFFVSNNKTSGSRINRFNRLDAGIDILFKEHENDSLFFDGVNQNRFWKEFILDNIVVGYVNVSQDRKAEFDRAISSLTRNGDKIAMTLQHEAIHAKQ